MLSLATLLFKNIFYVQFLVAVLKQFGYITEKDGSVIEVWLQCHEKFQFVIDRWLQCHKRISICNDYLAARKCSIAQSSHVAC